MSESEVEGTGAGATPASPVVTGEPVEIVDGVLVIADGRVPLVPNIGVVLGDRAALVVDTGMGPRNGQRVHDVARDLAGERDLFLTITHFHPEHGFGAQSFLDATIVYNREQRNELRAKGPAYIEMFRTFGPEVAEQLEGVELVEPQVVYDGAAAEVMLGKRRAELRTWGLAHTRGDQAVWLPDERVLFTGDLVENRFFPIFPFFPPDDVDVDGSRWITVLEELERLEPEIVVPGHGESGGAELVTATREFLTLLRSETLQLKREGVVADEIVTTLEPRLRERYPGWDAPEWISFGVRCFHAAG